MLHARCACKLTRRAAVAGLGAGLVVLGETARAVMPADGLVDVHHHLSPSAYVARIGRRTRLPPAVTDWTPDASIADMDCAGVAVSILSIASPGFWFSDASETREVARASNEYAASLVRSHPGRFGSFAALPLPDVDGTLAEIAYALDVLKANGVAAYTSYGNAWLGDPKFWPMLDELNRRRAVVYTHPVGNQCCVNLLPGVPDTVVELGTDTTRAMVSLVSGGASGLYPDIRFIFSHAGGTAPYLMERFRFLAASPAHAGRFPDGVDAMLRRFYYDTAQAFDPATMAALCKMVPASQIVFGTDYPYRTAAEHVAGLGRLDLPKQEMAAISRGNALGLIPRLAS